VDPEKPLIETVGATVEEGLIKLVGILSQLKFTCFGKDNKKI
jgi:hypothetical protein